MAPKGSKRSPQAAAASVAPEPKKQKVNPLVTGVVEAIRMVELPEDCKSMLIAMVPTCFSAPAERHESQDMVASWIEEVLNGQKAKFQEELDALEREAANVESSKEGLEKGVQDAKAALSAGKEALAAKEANLAEADKALAESRKQLQDAEGAEERAAARLAEAKKDKETVESLLQEAAQLNDEQTFQASLAEKFVAALKPLAPRLGLDESLTVALPSVCARAPAERSNFDRAAMEQLGSILLQKVEKLNAEVEAGAPSSEQCAEAIAAAKHAVEVAEEGRKTAGAEREEAEAQQQRLTAAVGEAEAAAAAFTSGRGPAEEVRKEKAAALQNFTGYHMECFNLLCKKAAPAGA